VRARVPASHAIEHRERDPGRGVHREVDGDQVGAAHARLVERLHGEVEASDLELRPAEPCGRLRQPEGLAPQFVRRDQEHPHD
jgi:hypothetical protein